MKKPKKQFKMKVNKELEALIDLMREMDKIAQKRGRIMSGEEILKYTLSLTETK